MINRAKFGACTSSSFRGIKTDTQTDRIALYILDLSNQLAISHIHFKIIKARILCNSKHFIPYNVFFLNKNTEFSKLHKICSRTKSVLICKILFILVPFTFGLSPITSFAPASTLNGQHDFYVNTIRYTVFTSLE